MNCVDPVCEAFSFLPPPVMVALFAIMCSFPLWGIFFVVPLWQRHKRRSSPKVLMAVHSPFVGGFTSSADDEETAEELEFLAEQLEEALPSDDESEPTPIPQGVGELEFYEFVQLWLSNRDENPHMQLDGPTGAGKTFTAEAMAHAAQAAGDELLVINVNHRAGQWGDNVITVDDDGELDTIERTFKWLIYEIGRRSAVLKSQGAHALRPLTIFWDELPETVEDIKIANVFLRKVLRRGRAVKMYLVGIVQLDTGTEAGLKGRAGLRRGFRQLLLGNTARLKAPHLFPLSVERPALLLWSGASYIVDRTDIADTIAEPLDPDAFVKPDLTKVSDVDAVKWSARHVQAVAILLKTPNVSITAVTKELFPKSNGAGPYREKAKAILAEVRAALLAGQKRSVADDYEEEEEEEEDDEQGVNTGIDRGAGNVAVG